jgi:hypothetical protein
VGAQRHGTIVVAGAVDLLPGEETIEMRYDPEDPTVFGIETAVNAIPDRRAGAYRVIALCAFASLLAGVIAALFARPLLRMRRLARRGDEAVATITRVACKVSNGIVTDTRTVTWRIGDGPVRTTTMSGRVGLAWLHATEPHALALVGGKHAVLLTRAFAPVRLEGDELAAATAKIESARELEELADWIVISPAHAKATDRA